MSVSYSHSSDEQLMAAYVNGNLTAFETLYARHESVLLRFIQRILGHSMHAQVEEVYQDVWIRIINAREKYTPPNQGGALWKTWAFAIAHNTAVDRIRAQSKFITVEPVHENEGDPMEWIQSSLQQTHYSSEDAAFWKAAGHQLLQCIETLPNEQRAVFLLHHEQDHSIEEMSEQLNVPFETLKSRLRYAMQKLRKCMRHYLKEIGGAR